MARAFVFGALSVIPAIFIEFLFSGKSLIPSTLECFLVVGPTEELCKLLATWFAVRKENSFDKPADGIVYAAATSLGFAFAENLYYFASVNSHTFVVRAGLSVPMHVLEAVPWAVALGRIKCDDTAPKRLLISGFIVASLVHGMFDALCFQIAYPHDTAFIVLLLLTLFEWRLYVLSMKETLRLGRRLMTRRMFSSSKMRKEVEPAPPFNWRWFVMPMLIASAISIVAWITLKSSSLRIEPGQAVQLDVAIISLLMIGLGILVAYRSPGRTIRESSLALALSGFSLSFITGWPSASPLESGVYFAALGAFGSWLGEMLQDEELHRTHKTPQES